MIKVAVTGNIGSGKTTVCRIFESLGIPVYYADQEAKKLYSDGDVIGKVKDLFGDGIFNKEGRLEHARLAAIVFSDPQKLQQLNNIIHPLVLEAFMNWTKSHHEVHYIVYESALLFESGFLRHFDHSILVTAPRELAMSRVMRRDNSSVEDFEKRADQQMEEAEKHKLADHIIRNDESIALIPQVVELHNIFQNQ